MTQNGSSSNGNSILIPVLLSPMGIGIGMAISELSSSDSQMIVAIFQVQPNSLDNKS